MVASSNVSSRPMPEPTPHEDAEHISGLTHPSRYLCAAGHLWKRRGKLTSAIGNKAEWVERLFVMTETAVCWFDQMHNSYGVSPSPIGAQCGRIDVRHFVSMSVVERPGGVETRRSDRAAHTSTSARPGAAMPAMPTGGSSPAFVPSIEDLERLGPRHTLEIHTITAEQTLIVGSTDRAVIDAWLAVLSKAVGTASTAGVSAMERVPAPAPLSEPTPPELLPVLSPENSGVRACGIMQKARGGLERTFRDHRKDPWSTRLLVLTESHLVYYKQSKPPEDDGPLFWGVGSTLRAGEFIFGQERGRMPLANADVYVEKVNDDAGVEWFHITLTAPLHNEALGISPDSFFSKGIAKMALGIGANSDRFKATLRTHDKALAAEWAAVLRSACGATVEKRYSKLHAAITLGDAAAAADIATELAQLRNKVPHRSDEGSGTPIRRSGRRDSALRLVLSADSGRSLRAAPIFARSTRAGSSGGTRISGGNRMSGGGGSDGGNSDGEILGTELPDPMAASVPISPVALDEALSLAHAALVAIASDARAAAIATPRQPEQLAAALNKIAANATAAALAASNNAPSSPGGFGSSADAGYTSSAVTSAIPSALPSPTSFLTLSARAVAPSSPRHPDKSTASAQTSVAPMTTPATTTLQDSKTLSPPQDAGPPVPPPAAMTMASTTKFASVASPAAMPLATTLPPATPSPADTLPAHKSSPAPTTPLAPTLPAATVPRATPSASSLPVPTVPRDTAPALTTLVPTTLAPSLAAPAPMATSSSGVLRNSADECMPTSGASAAAELAVEAVCAASIAAQAAAEAAAQAVSDTRPLPGHLTAAGVDPMTTPTSKCWATAGDGTRFDLRKGPDYKRNKKKAPSAPHIYHLVAADVLRAPKITPHVASRVRMPIPDDADEENDTGLPRTLVFNVAIPVSAPSLIGGSDDSKCYQLILYFRASVKDLRAWRDGGSAAYALFRRWVKEAPEGNNDVKERFKLVVKMENLKDLGKTGSTLEQYNGKPVLITKSGSIFPSLDDVYGPLGYLELGINTFRFAYLTKLGMSKFIPSLQKLKLHIGVVIEGRDNNELPEQTLVACRIHGLDLREMASELPGQGIFIIRA